MSEKPSVEKDAGTHRALTVKQATMLWVVEQNEPLSVADAAMHTMMTESAARSSLNALERKGLVGRTYTGHHRGSLFAFEITRKGARSLARADTLLDPDIADGNTRPIPPDEPRP